MATTLESPQGHGKTDRGLLEAANATAQDPKDRPAFEGKFGRMFPGLRGAAFFMRDLDSLATAMGAEEDNGDEATLDPEENLGLPAGYTYFGQFIDHDLTLDAVSLSMKKEDVSATINFRTPSLDLDCLYGRGPDDQPYMYDSTGRLFLMGDRDLTAGPGGPVTSPDLPRFRERALIGDKRNDENTIVSQLQGLFLRFHNQIAQMHQDWSFDDVRQCVQWNYQWLVLYDYLPRIVGPEMVNSILPHLDAGSTVDAVPAKLQFYRWDKSPALPVEFSGAAYRFGHSMVRPQYRLSSSNNVGENGRVAVFRPKNKGPGLNGFGEMPIEFGIEWKLFFDSATRKLADHNVGATRIQPAYKIDTSLVFPLMQLPEFSDDDGNPRPPTATNILALRNLMRGMMLSLPSGQAVARAMGLIPLTDEQLLVGKADDSHFADGVVAAVSAAGRTSMQDSAPLWFYILAEARHRWKTEAAASVHAAGAVSVEQVNDIVNKTPTRLGPVGGRIVAETLIGVVLGNPASFLNSHHTFQPVVGLASSGPFARMSLGDLAAFVAGN